MLTDLNLIGQLYVGLFAVSGVVCFAAISRAQKFEDPDVRRGLVGLLATAGGWSVFKAVGFLLPDPFRVPVYIVGLAVGFSTVWAWLYFCSAYSGRSYHRNTMLRRISAAIFLTVTTVKATNPLHGPISRRLKCRRRSSTSRSNTTCSTGPRQACHMCWRRSGCL